MIQSNHESARHERDAVVACVQFRLMGALFLTHKQRISFEKIVKQATHFTWTGFINSLRPSDAYMRR